MCTKHYRFFVSVPKSWNSAAKVTSPWSHNGSVLKMEGDHACTLLLKEWNRVALKKSLRHGTMTGVLVENGGGGRLYTIVEPVELLRHSVCGCAT